MSRPNAALELFSSRRPWLACALCVALRLPSLRYGTISDDEAIYDAMAQEVLAGGVMYRDTVDHKPPGLVYTYAAVERVAGKGPRRMAAVHLAGLLAALATCLALWVIARRLLGDELALWPPLLYALTSAAKVPVDGLAVNGELLMNLPTALAVASVLAATATAGARRFALDVLAGALVAAAVLYKYQAGLVLVAFGALTLGREPLRRCVSRCLAWLAGFAGPLALCAWYFHRQGALRDAISWGLGFNRNYLAAASPLSWELERLGWQLLGVVLPGALLYFGGFATLVRLVRGPAPRGAEAMPQRAFLAAWSSLAVGAVGLGGRFFGHYFLQPELPLALAAAGPVAQLRRSHPRLCAAALAVPALVFFLGATLPPAEPGRWLDPGLPDYAGIGAAVAARTRADETIWVWGNAPQIYYTAQRRPGVRFTFCNYLTGLSPGTPSEYDPSVDPQASAVAWAWRLALDDLEQRRPALILDTAAANLKSYGKFPIAHFPAFARYLASHYRRDEDALGVPIYRRRGGPELESRSAQ